MDEAKIKEKTRQSLREKRCKKGWRNESTDKRFQHLLLQAQLAGVYYEKLPSLLASLNEKRDSRSSELKNLIRMREWTRVSNYEDGQPRSKKLLQLPEIAFGQIMKGISGANIQVENGITNV